MGVLHSQTQIFKNDQTFHESHAPKEKCYIDILCLNTYKAHKIISCNNLWKYIIFILYLCTNYFKFVLNMIISIIIFNKFNL